MTINEITIKKVTLCNGFFVLAIPDENNYHSMYLLNEKEPGAMRLFGYMSPRIDSDEILKHISFDGFMYNYSTWEAVNETILDVIYADVDDDETDDE